MKTLEKPHKLLEQCSRKANHLTKQNDEKLVIKSFKTS